MKVQTKISTLLAYANLLAVVIFMSACASIENPRVEPFLASNPPPVQQELRWSNGKLPKSIDPAKAAAPPETDIVRAIYDGLTDLDSRSLRVRPAIAESWESSDGNRVWTFKLRPNARWTNGERVTAGDFVRSWKRLRSGGVTSSKSSLTINIVGFRTSGSDTDVPDFLTDGSEREPIAGLINASRLQSSNAAADNRGPIDTPTPRPGAETARRSSDSRFGVVAIDEMTLQVTLELPDMDLPSLVADPIFRPVHESFDDRTGLRPDAAITNGAFELERMDQESLVLGRSSSYWNSQSVALQRVRFVQTANSEAALKAYRNGELDVITNAMFEPGALKLLQPFGDFKRSAHAALNFYKLNTNDAPLTDRRVREALAISIDRERLADGELQGTTKPATGFLPWNVETADELVFDPGRGRELLARAGFPNGDGFPNLRLVVNRNDAQQRVARTVRKMWQDTLNITVEIDVKDNAELLAARDNKDFDLIRRGTVFAIPNEIVNMTAIFDSPIRQPSSSRESDRLDIKPTPKPTVGAQMDERVADIAVATIAPNEIDLLTEDEALFEMAAIPLYFPISYALVKPYVLGFELNSIDAASLKEISIDTAWKQPEK